MDRRTVLAISAALAFLVGYQWVIAKLYPPPAAAQATAPTTAPMPNAAAPLQPSAPQRAPVAHEHQATLTTDRLTAHIGADAGAITAVHLPEHRDLTTGEPIALTQPEDVVQRPGAFARLLLDGQPLEEPRAYTVTADADGATATALTGGLRLTKRYTVDGRTIRARLQLTNTTPAPMRLDAALIVSAPLAHATAGEAQFMQALTLQSAKVRRTAPGKARKQPVMLPGPHEVAGQVSKYFALLAAWEPSAETVTWRSAGKELTGEAQWSRTLQPNESQEIAITWYAGPKDYPDVLTAGTTIARLFPQGLLGTLGGALVACLRWLYRLTHNYGLAIIGLTVLVGTLLFPLTWMNLRMSRQTMAQMQVLQPKLERLRTQYKDNPQKLNREMMELYKKHNVNPLSQLGGCLPLLLQMPIFIALYNTINNSLELRGARFLWIHDLAAPDRAWIVAGFPINALPLLMMGAMFLQMKLSPMKPAATPGAPNMTTIMTLMFGIMFYSLPSGLVLYWLTNTLLTLGIYAAMRVQPAAPAVAASS